MAEQRRTSTSSFGIGRRESHDASQFYAPFRPPEIDDDENVACAPDLGDGSIEGDIRERDDVPDSSVALMVTSPPYFAGTAYEEALGQGKTPTSYGEFPGMLRDVFSVCARKQKPGDASPSTSRTSVASGRAQVPCRREARRRSAA